jgi:hypothetical protein
MPPPLLPCYCPSCTQARSLGVLSPDRTNQVLWVMQVCSTVSRCPCVQTFYRTISSHPATWASSIIRLCFTITTFPHSHTGRARVGEVDAGPRTGGRTHRKGPPGGDLLHRHLFVDRRWAVSLEVRGCDWIGSIVLGRLIITRSPRRSVLVRFLSLRRVTSTPNPTAALFPHSADRLADNHEANLRRALAFLDEGRSVVVDNTNIQVKF